MGIDPATGVSLPDFERLAYGFGIAFRRCRTHAELTSAIRETLVSDSPQMCEVVLDITQPFAPKLSSRKLPDGRMISAPLEDLSPFLPREELKANMIVPLHPDSEQDS